MRSRLRPRPKIIKKKSQWLTTYDLRLLPEKLTKFSEFYTYFARKMPDYITRQRDRARPRPKPRGRGQSFEAVAEAKILASRPLWPRGLNTTGYLPTNSQEIYARQLTIKLQSRLQPLSHNTKQQGNAQREHHDRWPAAGCAHWWRTCKKRS